MHRPKTLMRDGQDFGVTLTGAKTAGGSPVLGSIEGGICSLARASTSNPGLSWWLGSLASLCGTNSPALREREGREISPTRL